MKINSTRAKQQYTLYKMGKLGKTLPGTKPFNPMKPTIVLTKKVPLTLPTPKGVKPIYYKVPYA